MNSKRIMDDIEFVKKYSDRNLLIGEPDFEMRRLFTIYNTVDILVQMHKHIKSKFDIDDMSTMYELIYNNMATEMIHRYQARKRLLINPDSVKLYDSNILYLINISQEHYKKKIILQDSDTEEETIDPEKEIVNKTITILDDITNVIQYKPFQILILSLVIYVSLTFF